MRPACAPKHGLIVDDRLAIQNDCHVAVHQCNVQRLPLADRLFCCDSRADTAVDGPHVVRIERLSVALTYLQKSYETRVIPYAEVCLIGIPFTSVRLTEDLLAIPHEVGHYVFWNSHLKDQNGQELFAVGCSPCLSPLPGTKKFSISGAEPVPHERFDLFVVERADVKLDELGSQRNACTIVTGETTGDQKTVIQPIFDGSLNPTGDFLPRPGIDHLVKSIENPQQPAAVPEVRTG